MIGRIKKVTTRKVNQAIRLRNNFRKVFTLCLFVVNFITKTHRTAAVFKPDCSALLLIDLVLIGIPEQKKLSQLFQEKQQRS